MKEIWKDIKGFGNYQISSFGNVRNKNYHRQNVIKEIKQTDNGCGYLRVALCKGSKTSYFYVHRLVGEHFLENKNNEKCINHKNGIRSDNRAENLEWCSYSYNVKYSYDKLGHKLTEKHLKKFINAGKEKNKKKVICVETNQIFDSAKEASKFIGLYKGAVSNACIKNKPVGGYHWKYL